MKPKFSMREALQDEALLGSVLAGDSWLPWRTMLLALRGEQLTADERRIFQQFTGRPREPAEPVHEAAFIVGRRGGKDRAASVLACYVAGLVDHRDVLVPGEKGLVLLIAPDQRQAQITRGYIEACFSSSPLLAQLIVNSNNDVIELSNGINIEVRAASFRRLRGVTAVCCIASECAFWHDNETSSNPDSEILNAVRPALSTTRGPLVLISSPYSRRGVLWDIFKRHFGPEGDAHVLVAQGTTRDFNSTLAQSVIDRAYQEDPASAAAEYGGRFRLDLEAFVSRDAVDRCIEPGVFERSPLPGVGYVGFVDPAGGSGQDSMSLCVAHLDGDTVVIDALRERRPPFSPTDCVAEFCETLKSYHISVVVGDRWGGEFAREPFRTTGSIFYKLCDRAKSDLYRDFLPLVNARKVCLLDHPKSVNQICALERRTGTTRDIIDHGRGANAHDDLANAVAGVAVMTAQKHRRFAPDLSVVSLPTYCVNGVITNTLDGGVRHGGRVQTMADVRDADW